MLKFDHHREMRTHLPESVFCQNKTPAMVEQIIQELADTDSTVLYTRLSADKVAAIPPELASLLDYHESSETAVQGNLKKVGPDGKVALVTAGTSDLKVASEAVMTLEYLAVQTTLIADVGVAGLWRLEERLEEINRHDVVIIIAGMDAALASVLGGLTYRPIIGVPTSTGYGATEAGRTALNSMLVSCSPGITVVNIDNGYGAACAAARILQSLKRG